MSDHLFANFALEFVDLDVLLVDLRPLLRTRRFAEEYLTRPDGLLPGQAKHLGKVVPHTSEGIIASENTDQFPEHDASKLV